MPEALLNVLKICLLLLLYLFFFRVLRAVWTEVNLVRVGAGAPAPRVARRVRKAERKPPQLTVVEPSELAGTVYPLGDELTLGRASACQVVLDDTYASQVHARIFQREGQLYVEDLGSTNGTYLNRRKVSGPMVVSHGDKIQVGSTVMELA